MTFEYKVVAAPTRGRRVKGVKTAADRFARTLEDAINALAEDGWEYLRTDTLPSEERQGLTGRTTIYQNMLVFRRAVEVAETATTAEIARAPDPVVAPRPAAGPDGEPDASEPSALNTLIEQEIAAARAPRLPSAGAAQQTPGAPVKAPAVDNGKSDVAAE